MDKPGGVGRTAIVQRLFEGIENELSLHRPRNPPADGEARAATGSRPRRTRAKASMTSAT
jgi:hypothetical protein